MIKLFIKKSKNKNKNKNKKVVKNWGERLEIKIHRNYKKQSLQDKSDKFVVIIGIRIGVFLNGGLLISLVLGYQIVNGFLSFRKLQLVHTLGRVPVHKGFSAEHGCELLGDSLEQNLFGNR